MGEYLDSKFDANRAEAIAKLVGTAELPREVILGTIQFYEGAQRFKEAADVAAAAGMRERATGLYEKAIEELEEIELYGVAADLATKAGLMQKAKELYGRAGQVYRQLARHPEVLGIDPKEELRIADEVEGKAAKISKFLGGRE